MFKISSETNSLDWMTYFFKKKPINHLDKRFITMSNKPSQRKSHCDYRDDFIKKHVNFKKFSFWCLKSQTVSILLYWDCKGGFSACIDIYMMHFWSPKKIITVSEVGNFEKKWKKKMSKNDKNHQKFGFLFFQNTICGRE